MEAIKHEIKYRLDEIQKEKKQKRKNRLEWIQCIHFFKTRKHLHNLGFACPLKKCIQTFLCMQGILIALCYFSRIQILYTVSLCLLLCVLYPFFLRAYYMHLYHLQRFEMVVSYVENCIPIFEMKPVIVYALSEVVDVLEKDIRLCVEKAIDCILDSNEKDVYKKAFYMIEENFPNSRIIAMHQMMKNVETLNSKNCSTIVSNVYADVQAWITRTYNLHKDLQNRKFKLLLLLFLTMCCSIFFTNVFATSNLFDAFIDMKVYQLCTTIFLMICLILFCVFYSLMDGKSMVNDYSMRKEEQNLKAFDRYVIRSIYKKDEKEMYVFFLLSLIAFVCSCIFNTFKLLGICIGCILFYVFIQYKNKRNDFKRIRKALELEFPLWLRDVCLNLQNFTVVNAIALTKQTSSLLMRYYIEQFLWKVENNPISMEPYTSFLKTYDLPDVKADLKVLYALSGHTSTQIEKEIQTLVERNVKMMDKVEKIKHMDVVLLVERLGYIPVLLFIFNMFINMGLLFFYFIQYMNQAIQFSL